MFRDEFKLSKLLDEAINQKIERLTQDFMNEYREFEWSKYDVPYASDLHGSVASMVEHRVREHFINELEKDILKQFLNYPYLDNFETMFSKTLEKEEREFKFRKVLNHISTNKNNKDGEDNVSE